MLCLSSSSLVYINIHIPTPKKKTLVKQLRNSQGVTSSSVLIRDGQEIDPYIRRFWGGPNPVSMAISESSRKVSD